MLGKKETPNTENKKVADKVLNKQPAVKPAPVTKKEEKPKKSGKETKTVTQRLDDLIFSYLNNTDSKIKNNAMRLKTYEDKMCDGTMFDENAMIAIQKDFYLLLMSVISIKDYNELKKQFEVINTFFLRYNKSAFRSNKLLRFDHLLGLTPKQNTSYQNLIVVISTLCDPVVRTDPSRKSKINLELALDPKETDIPVYAGNNIKRFYNA